MSDSRLHPNTERLQSFAEGILGEGDRVVLESHLLGCPECTGQVEEWRALFSMLSELPQYEPSIHFADNVMHGVQLPDPWYVRALVLVGDRVQKVAPKTTRGWAFASACMALPFTAFAILATWLLSKPYITPSNVLAFIYHRSGELMTAAAQSAFATIMQTDIALAVARALSTIMEAGVGTAGALLAGVAAMTAASAYVLYQNLFRAQAHRNRRYVTYSF